MYSDYHRRLSSLIGWMSIMARIVQIIQSSVQKKFEKTCNLLPPLQNLMIQKICCFHHCFPRNLQSCVPEVGRILILGTGDVETEVGFLQEIDTTGHQAKGTEDTRVCLVRDTHGIYSESKRS